MPFMVQTMRIMNSKIDTLVEEGLRAEAAKAEEKRLAEEALAAGYSDGTMSGYADPNALAVYGSGMNIPQQYGGSGYGYQ